MLATGCYRLLAELRALQASMLGVTLLNDEHELLVGCDSEPPSSFGPSLSDRHTRPSAGQSRFSSELYAQF